MYILTLFSGFFQRTTPVSSINIPLWVFWLLIGLIGALVILLFIRDRTLRMGLKKLFSTARRRVKKAQMESRIKKENKEKERALTELGQKAWSIGVKPKQGEDVIKNIESLEETKTGFLKENASFDSEIEMLQEAHEKYRKNEEEKIKEQEEQRSPHVEYLSQIKEDLKQAEADLSHIEKEVRTAEKVKTDAEKDITKNGENSELSNEIRQIKIEELKARVFESNKKKEDLEIKRPSIQEQKSKLLQQKTDEQDRIKEYDQIITTFQEEIKDRRKTFEKEKKELQKKKDVLSDKNKEIEEKKKPLFAQLGKSLFEQRVESPELTDTYKRIETIDKAVQEYEEKRQELK